jgi:preprotein translocase subunit SecE
MLGNTIQRTTTFLYEVRAEMQKVTWPSWVELKGQTIVVIIAVIIIAAFIGLVDNILNRIVAFVFTRLG